MTHFDPQRVKRWRREVWRIFTPYGFLPPAMSAVMVLAAVDAFGTHLGTLSEVTGLSEAYVRQVLRRLRKSRVLSGQTMRVAWDQEAFAVALDAMVAAGIIVRSPDEKRSAAQKACAPETRARGPKRKAITAGGPFTPKRQKSNPLYGLQEWDKPTVGR